MTAEKLVAEMPKGLIKWYDFKKGRRALYITAMQPTDETMKEALSECGLHVDSYMPSELIDLNVSYKYDYIMIMSAIERTANIEDAKGLLNSIRALLKDNGTLLLGMDNRLGIRYFCGDRDIYTGRNFDGIENYVRAQVSDFDLMTGRNFAKDEILDILEAAGFTFHRFYSVFPVLDRPQILFAEDYVPVESLDTRIFPQYNYPDTVFLEEERLYNTLIRNGMFHTMANGFLIECPLEGNFSNARQITVSADRGKENAAYTIIRRDNKVQKKAMYREGEKKLSELLENHKYLSDHGIHMVEILPEKKGLIMPYINAMSAVEYLRSLLVRDKEIFFEGLDQLWQVILSSSDHVPYAEIDWDKFDPYWEKSKIDDPSKDKWKRLAKGTKKEQDSLGVVLKRGYIDLVPLNCFWWEGNFVFYDQECYVENLPAKVIMLRTIDLIYMGNQHLFKILPEKDVKGRYGLLECQTYFYPFVSKFLNELRNDQLLRFYHEKVRRNIGVLNANRQRMNYSVNDYERTFRDILKGAESRKLYLFGSGNFARQFISQFGQEYQIAGLIDNDPSKWGMKINDIPINSPDVLKSLEKATYKVIICIKNFTAVIRQLQNMGIMDYGIYDSNLAYPRIQKKPVLSNEEQNVPKKYHTGYIAGVFDLFHVGHLNMFKRAKELCEHLIVGVVTDEGVMKDKKTMPFVPFGERMEMVRSCKYVDEAVEIPIDCSNTDEAYRRYQFDVQFSGSDYEHDEAWLAKKEFLQKQGADLIFFPYTQSTNSTKIKGLINKKLM